MKVIIIKFHIWTIIDIGYGSYCTSFTGEQKHKKVVPEYIGGA
jgi:hypothetical protein